MRPIDPIQTPRLVLRAMHEDDADFILDALNQPSFLQFIGDRNVRTAEQARAYIRSGPLQSYCQFGYGMLIVQRRAGGERLGLCGLVKRDYLDHPDLGFAFLPQFWSQGFAFEAAKAVLDHAASTLQLRCVLAIVQPDNVASLRLLTKLGMRAEGSVTPKPGDSSLLLLAMRG